MLKSQSKVCLSCEGITSRILASALPLARRMRKTATPAPSFSDRSGVDDFFEERSLDVVDAESFAVRLSAAAAWGGRASGEAVAVASADVIVTVGEAAVKLCGLELAG